jgi:peptidoglycan/LPS O-acetylase OafA/YrhL
VLRFALRRVNDVFYRILSAILGGSLAIVAAWFMARKSGFYKSVLTVSSERALPLDGLRGLMAWSVFVHHTDIARQWLRTGTWSCDSDLVLFFGKGAVLVFFMITGFLFWGKAVDSEGNLAPFPFWMKRLRRLAPLYTLSAVLIFIMAANAWLAASGSARLNFAARLFSLGFLDWSRLPGYKLITANAGVQWSLWYEWRFYLALPLLAWLAHGKRIFLLGIIGLFAVPWLDLTSNESIYWIAFLPGMAAVYLVRNPAIRNILTAPASAAIALAWCVGILALSRFGGMRWSLLAVIPVFWTAVAGNGYWGVLVHPAIRFLGTISYSVYLLHGIFLLAVLKTMGRVIDLAALPLPGYCCLVGVTAILLVLICAVTYRYIEHPFLTWRSPRERVAKARPPVSIPQPAADIG